MENLEGEIWKPIVYKGIDYAGRYQISNMGRIKNVKKNTILYGSNTNGYKNIRLCFNGKYSLIKIHRLVICCFDRIPEDAKKEVIDHINSNKSDNRLSNLRILSFRENTSRERVVKSGMPCGVHYLKYSTYKYIVCQIRIDSKKVNLGRYTSIEAASIAYNLALNATNKGFRLGKILNTVNKYRISIGLKQLRK
jgi:hypothetical protein